MVTAKQRAASRRNIKKAQATRRKGSALKRVRSRLGVGRKKRTTRSRTTRR